MIDNLTKNLIKQGARIKPIYVPLELSGGTGQTNPSVFIDNNRILVNLRGVQYVLLHSINEHRFPSRWGPLAYLNPENDLHLRTTNFLLELNANLEIISMSKVDTSALDVAPVWEFIGQEDVRIAKWDNKYWYTGVRRDTKIDGEGRIELSEIKLPEVKEVSRYRIEPPSPTYCEKNWMPILDMPYHFVKWTNPTEIIRVDIDSLSSETVFMGKTIEGTDNALRGSSQVISYKDYYVALVHGCYLFRNELQQKDAIYYHRFVIWNKDWEIVKMSDQFHFLDSMIEFCCGMAIYKDKALITFGFQDNASYILEIPINVWEELIWNL